MILATTLTTGHPQLDAIIYMSLGLVAIAGAAVIAKSIRVAEPLVLVLVGIIASFVPFIPNVELDPEWILAGVLPPLLYSTAVSMPAMDFRREFNAISGLSVVLVVFSAVLTGFFFSWIVPGLSVWWGIALGAIVSPTDAAAVAIAKRAKLSGRVISILEGEGLLNDATALVLLRSAIVATAASVSLWHVAGTFIMSVGIATAVGLFIGFANLWIRSKIADTTVNTVISFAIPLFASVPAELLNASGLVAAVVAGLVTGHGAVRWLTPRQRLSDTVTWRAIELILEGAIFLTMGLQLSSIVEAVREDRDNLGIAVATSAGALILTLVIRAAFVIPLLGALRKRNQRGARMRPRVEGMAEKLERAADGEIFETLRRQPSEKDIARGQARVSRFLADLDYYTSKPLGRNDGMILVWAGMRGAVTLAAAQTLPEDAPHRSLLVLIAFLVALSSLMVQGLTLPPLVRRLTDPDRAETVEAERAQLHDRLRLAADGEDDEFAKIMAEREELLRARHEGLYDSETLREALRHVDGEQLRFESDEGWR